MQLGAEVAITNLVAMVIAAAVAAGIIITRMAAGDRHALHRLLCATGEEAVTMTISERKIYMPHTYIHTYIHTWSF